MALIKLLSLFTFLLLAGCNFGDESGADSGGGLFSGHKPAENVTTILPPPNATYVESDAIIFKVSHPFNMTVSGSPIINFDIGGTPVQASYVSGNGSKTLFFSYTVQAGENDSDGIDFTSLDFNGGDITFTHAGGTESITTTVDSPNTNSVYVDTQGPQVVIVVPPSNDTYLVNQELNFLATFDQAVSVSGTPSLELNIGGSTVNATYISGSGTNSLIFRHTVQATDVDNDGIQMNSPLLLTGGSLSDVNGNSATLTYTPTPMPLVLVDGDRPWAQTITYPANNSYTPGQHLDFVLQFTEAVNVTNNPRLSIDVGGVTKFANYLSGTGTDTLTFRYTVVSGDVDSDGIELQNLIDLNTTGTIQDLTAVNADLNLDVVLTPGIIINGILPEVDTITPPVDGTYKLGDVIYFNLNFNTNVDVTGFPILDMELDSSSPGSVDILYNAGSGTNSLVMRYVVQNGDLDQDGITLISPLDLNSGTIQDVNLTNANLDITTAIAAVDTSNIFIDGVPPTVTSITPPADDDYEAGQNLDFILNFNEAVDVVGGVPSIDLDIGSNVTATYVSGTGTNALTFRYTVQIGDQDLDGIEILANDISLNGATLEDAATNSALLGISGVIPNTTGVTIDGIIPTITSIDVPTFQYYNETDTLQFTVHTSEAVYVTIATPRIAIDIGGSTVYADYQSGGGTTALVFEYTIAAGLEDHDGITLTSPLDANGATIEDSYGNDLDLDFSGVMPDSSGVLVDSLLPTVSSVTPPSDDTYADTENLDFVINFNEAVDVAGGTPYIDINIDGVTRQAQYNSGTGTSALTFRYTIVTDEEDLDGIQFVGNTINLNGATIQDIGGNDIDTDMTVNSALPSLAAVNVEAIHPTITGVTPPADTTYIIGDNLDFIVQFDENVDITNTPRIEITLNSGTVYADYLSGTGTQNITFRYTVAASEEDLDGITLVTPLDLNTSGTILDQWGNTAELPYTPPVTTGILVDGVIPTVTIDTYPNIDFTNEATYTFSGTCSENGELVNVDIGGLTDTPTCTALAWSSTIDTSTLAESADNTVADITITADHADAGGNDAVQASQLVIKDSIIPTVSSNSVNTQVYIIGDSMQVIVNYNEVVTVSGTPRIAVTLDTQASTPIYATYTGGSGSSILSFEYTIQDGDEDNTGTDLNASIDANGGSIVDNLSNETDYNLVTTSFAGAIVDGIRPTISAVNIPSNTYYANDNILVTLTFDDNVTIAGGSPTISLSFETNVGGPAAVYSSGSTTNSIVFDYPVIAGNEDTNGIDLSTGVVSLGGATIQDANGNDAVLTIPTTNFPTVLVDAIVPTVTINTPLDNIDATNVASYTIDGTCSENGEVVTVNIGGVSATPTCTALAWSTTMDLSAVSESADNTVADVAVTADHDDAGGNSAIQATDTIIKDSIIPTVSSNAITASTYIIGDTVQVQVAFNEAVTVSGTPRIQLNFETEAASPVYANYTAGSGSSNLTFEYTVLAGDEDINGIAGAGSIDLNGGSIVDNLSNETDYNLVSTSYASAFVDGIAPQVTAVAITANTYYATETLTVSVTFDDNITVSGSPEIPLTFDTSVGSPSAVYNAGDGSTTLTFDYLVAAGNEDTNGIDLAAAITLSGGTLQDANGNDSALTLSTTNFPTVLIDAIVPTVTITGPLANINNTNESAYTIDGTCSENGEVVTVNIGGVSATPTCTALAWSTTMDLSAVSESADNTVADVAVTADHDDAGGNSAIQATDTIIKDSIIPTVTSNSIAAGTSAIGDTIQVSVVFNEVVSVTGTPRIELDFETEASGPVYATYSGGDGTNTLTFDYTVLAGDEDTNGIVNVGSIDPNSGSIDDNLSNTSDYVLATTANAASFVDGIAPQVTAVAITANTYYATETLTVSVTFDDNITVSGSPEIPLTFDTSVGSPSAVYNAGDGSTTLTFDYLVIAGNEDTNGIDLAAAITLSGGTLQDANGNDSALTLSTTNFPTVLVDAIVPTVTITGPLANINNANESAYTIDGTCSENGEVVTVNIGGVSATPTCTALAWSTTMDLTAVAQSADNTVADVAVTADHDDAGGNSAVQATDTIIKDSIIPTVTSNSIAAGTSAIGDTVQVSVVFNEAVSVTGTPRIELDFETEASGPVYASYSGGDGTNTLTFDYTVLAGDEDTNGIVNVGSIDPNSGSIDDNLSNTSDYVLATTANAASFVDGIAPQVTAVAITANTYYATETLTVSVTFDDNITVSGSPEIPLTFDTSVGSPSAVYNAGDGSTTLTFDYLVVAGNEDTNGIDLAAAITLSGGTLQDANGNDSALTLSTTNFPTVLIDAIVPTVTIDSMSNINAINTASYNVSGTCSENGQIVTINIGGVSATPTCTALAWSTTMDLTAVAQSADNTVADVAVTADHDDAGGNSAVQATDTIIKDSIIPTVTSNSIAAGTSAIGDTVQVSVVFNEVVNVSGTPRIQLNFETEAASPVYATYSGGDGTNTLTFDYTVLAGDEDTNGITNVGSIDPNSGSIDDNLSNTSDYLLVTTANAASFVDGIAPQVTAVAITANTYYATETLTVSVTFDDSITVSGGSPDIALTFETSSGSPTAIYNGGTGSNTLSFDYLVVAGNEDTNGIDLAASILPQGATLQDTNGNNAILSLSTTNFPSVFIDAIQPTVTINGPLANINNANESAYTIDGTCSENGEVVTVNIGGVSATPTCTALAWSTTMDLTAVTQSADNTVADVAVTADHDDAGGNSAVQATDTIIKDSIIPTITSNSIAAGTSAIGDTVQVSVVFNEAVSVTGTPRIELDFETEASGPVYASYSGGDGTNTLTFDYTVLAGDEDTNGIVNVGSIDPNSGSIDDNLSNTSDYVLATTANAASFVDGIAPQVTAVAITANTYYATETLTVSVTFDDNITVSGSPEIPLTFDTSVGSPSAVYNAGDGSTTLTFDYLVVAGNEDTNGIDLAAAITLSGGTLQDANGNDSTLTLSTTNFPTVLIDAIVPTVTIDAMANIISLNETLYNVSGTCSENGQIVTINIGGVSATPTCTALTWSTTMDLSAVSESVDNTVADVAVTADHDDAGGNSAVQATDTIIKDTIAPTVSSNNISASTFKIGDSIDVSVTFNEVVNVTGGSPRIELNFETEASGPIYANYSSGTGTNTLVFSYTVLAGDEDTNGISSVGSIDANGATIADILDNSADYNLASTSYASSFVDGIAPQVTAVAITSNTYYATETLTVSVTFDDNITVSGSPEIPLTFDTSVGSPSAVYNAGDGTTTLTFDYLVVAGNEDTNGIDLAAAITLSGGTLQDANGNDSALTLSTTNFPTVFIDAVVPTVTINTPLANIDSINESAYAIDGTCSENGQVVTVNIGGVSATPTCTALAWSTTMDLSAVSESVDNTVADVAVTADHDDAGGNSAVQATDTIIKDSITPYVTSNTATSGSLTAGETLVLSVSFNENVTVSGTPEIDILLNSGTVTAQYTGGSGTSLLTFEYNVLATDTDPDGIALTSNISLNGGSISDALSNSATLALSTTSFPGTTIEQTVTLAFAQTSEYDFGQKNVGSNTDVTMIINYTGTIDATSVTASNPSSQFTFKGGSFPGTGGTCSGTVSGNCTIVLTFSPDSAAVFSETITVSYNNGSGTVNATRDITGEGISTTPTKIAVIGPTGIITGDCIPFTIESQTDSDEGANVSSNENVSLVVNNGTGTFYSNSGCTTTTTTATISSGTSSTPIYFSTATPGQELTLVFNAATLENTTKVVISSNEPVDIYANVSAEIVTDECQVAEVSLLDSNGVKTGSSSSQTINIGTTGDVEIFSDAFCTGSISQLNFAAYEDAKNIYLKNASAEVVNLSFTDAGATLTTYNTSTEFVSNLTWWDTDWYKRKKLTISNLDQATTHSNMPVLVKLSSSRINYADFKANGEDIRFTLDDHTTVLDHSIEEWNSSGNSYVWVRLPNITASSEIEIYMYYDNTIASDTSNSGNVFTSYQGVWNMDKSGATYVDSSPNGRDGTAVGTVADQSGPIGNSIYVNGSSRIDLTYNLAQILGRTSTLSFWVKTTQVGNNTDWQAPGITGLSGFNASQDLFYSFLRADGRIGASAGGGTQVQSNFIINDNSWRHVTVSRSETTGQIKFYVNGVLNGSGNSGTGNKNQAFYCLGATRQLWGGGGYFYFNGSFDSMRMNNTILSDAAIKANFKYQNDTHVTYGQLEEL